MFMLKSLIFYNPTDCNLYTGMFLIFCTITAKTSQDNYFVQDILYYLHVTDSEV